jgi:hypothetical protein
MKKKYLFLFVLIFLSHASLAHAIDSLEEPDFEEEPTPRISLSEVRRGPASTVASPMAVKAPEKSDVDMEPTEASRFGVQEFSIIVTEKGFFPNKVIVRRNIPVNLYLTATDSRSLCFVMKKGEFNFHQGVGAKNVERISFRPTETGPFEFHCPINNIKGNLIVRD